MLNLLRRLCRRQARDLLQELLPKVEAMLSGGRAGVCWRMCECAEQHGLMQKQLLDALFAAAYASAPASTSAPDAAADGDAGAVLALLRPVRRPSAQPAGLGVLESWSGDAPVYCGSR